MPLASVCVTATSVPSASAGLGATDHVPSGATVVVKSGVPSPSVSTPISAPGSPVPEISVPDAAVIVGGVSPTLATSAGLSLPLASVCVTATSVPSASAGLGATDHVPSGATVVVKSGEPSPSISTPISAPGSPVPEISVPVAVVITGDVSPVTATSAGLSLPSGSVCTADTLVPSASAGLGATDHVPSDATVVVRSGVPSPFVSMPMVAPGSPVPEISTPEATVTTGALGATVSPPSSPPASADPPPLSAAIAPTAPIPAPTTPKPPPTAPPTKPEVKVPAAAPVPGTRNASCANTSALFCADTA